MSTETTVEETETSLATHELGRIEATIKFIEEENAGYLFLESVKGNEGFEQFIESYTVKERDRLAKALASDVLYKPEVIDQMTSMLGGIKSLNRFLAISALNFSSNMEEVANLKLRKKGITDGSIVLSDGQ